MNFKEEKNINYAQVADEVLDFWKKNKIFEASITRREGNPSFTFYEGPPSANGTPGIHHVMARTVKDVFCRYKTLKGFQVKRKGGWDTHGLPVELQVEKELGITKEDIGKKISVADYNRKCKEAVMKFKDEWDHLTEIMGYWVDLDDPYITFEREYMESVWHLLKKFFDADLLYKGYTIQPYSPAAGTGLSSHELNQPGCYREIKDTSITAQFKLKSRKNEFMLAWTTTPWTLPSNSALAIGEKLDYVLVDTFNPYTHQPVKVWLAKARMGSYFHPKGEGLDLSSYKPGDKVIPYHIKEERKGKDMLGWAYEPLMPLMDLPSPAFTVISGDFVTTEDGSGIVHLAKAFGADDYRSLEQNGVPGVFLKDESGKDIPLVDRQGKFLPLVGEYLASKMQEWEIKAHKPYGPDDFYVKNYLDEDENQPEYKSTDIIISILLKQENKAFKVEKYVHSYPHCWRTDKPVLYYPLDSWFIRTTAFKDRLVALNNTINWKPKSTGVGRFGNWLENLVDWNLSRSRFWGTPLPIWVSEDEKEKKCIGSLEELREEVKKSIAAGFMDKALPEDFDLHRPYVDDVVLVSESGQKMFREPDLIDVWFDSGAMPYAQWHYPFENKEVFESNYPADFIAEGVDQTRGWFFTLHTIAAMLFNTVAFKNVIANGLVLDKNGNKMSKRLGNAIDPFKTIATYGPDATRWYMMANSNPWDNLKFNLEGVAESQRRFFGTLQNTYAFFSLYANLDNFTYQEGEVSKDLRTESDRWILSKLNSLIQQVDEAYADYEPTKAARLIQDFTIDDLSNWYVRLNRKRFWKGTMNQDKRSAYQTLYTCLISLCKIGSPIAPFFLEKMYQDLNQVTQREVHESVHLCEWPEINKEYLNPELEERMRLAQTASSLVHSIRKKEKIKVRQPLSRILIPVLSQDFKEKVQSVESLILSEVNVKRMEYIDDASGVLVKKIKPNFRKLGQEYGPKMKEISQFVQKMDAEAIRKMEETQSLTLVLASGESIQLGMDDVEISSEDIPGWSVASEGALTVALDVSIDEELRREGIARDLVNRLQNLRKELGLDVKDKIKIFVEKGDVLVNQALESNREYICQETQAYSLDLNDKLADSHTFDLDELQLKVKIEVS